MYYTFTMDAYAQSNTHCYMVNDLKILITKVVKQEVYFLKEKEKTALKGLHPGLVLCFVRI